eukprot:565162-Rhodomonas_salina.1
MAILVLLFRASLPPFMVTLPLFRAAAGAEAAAGRRKVQRGQRLHEVLLQPGALDPRPFLLDPGP